MSRTVASLPERRAAVLRVLLVEPCLEDQRTLRGLLEKSGRYRLHSAREFETAAQLLLQESHFDVALVESGIWREEGAKLMRGIREQRPDMAIIVLTSPEDEREALPALKLGAHDFVSKRNLDAAQLGARIELAVEESRSLRRRDTMVRWLEREARTDHLTGFHNRRAFDEHLRQVCQDAQASGGSVTLVLMDIAGMRSVNEVHGHETGDTLIRRAAQAISCCVRGVDFTARVGGDDFAVVLAEGDIELGRRIARRVAQEADRLNGSDWIHELPVALIFGVASGVAPDAGELFAAAEEGVRRHREPRTAPHHYPFWEENDGPSVA